MATFEDAYTRLLRLVNRPASETDVLEGAKDAINDAIKLIQRNHSFKMTEKLANFTYPAGSLYVDLGQICGGPLRDVLSIQQVGEDGTVEGKPIQVMTYNQLQARRKKYDRLFSPIPPDTFNESLSGYTIEDGFRCDKIAFLVSNNLGLYPKPQTACYLVINVHTWLNDLVNDDDENFLLTYAMDVVIRLAYKHMLFYMKESADFAPSAAEVTDSIQTLIAWDNQIQGNVNP